MFPILNRLSLRLLLMTLSYLSSSKDISLVDQLRVDPDEKRSTTASIVLPSHTHSMACEMTKPLALPLGQLPNQIELMTQPAHGNRTNYLAPKSLSCRCSRFAVATLHVPAAYWSLSTCRGLGQAQFRR